MLGGAPEKRLTGVYCRVSSAGQKEDLQSQIAAMEDYCRAGALAVDEGIKEVGGGLTFKRKRFLELLDRSQGGEIAKRFLAHQDRGVRLGFDRLEPRALEQGCDLVVVPQESLSPAQDRVEDVRALVPTFSGRRSGMRKDKTPLKEDSAGRQEPQERLS